MPHGRAIAITFTLLCAGCGSLCAKGDAAAKAFTEKAAPCGATSPSPSFDRQACEDSMGRCSAQDARALDAYFDCLEQLPACDPAASAPFSAAVLACANGMQSMSAGCFAQ